MKYLTATAAARKHGVTREVILRTCPAAARYITTTDKTMPLYDPAVVDVVMADQASPSAGPSFYTAKSAARFVHVSVADLQAALDPVAGYETDRSDAGVAALYDAANVRQFARWWADQKAAK